jgi:hypothetical protein
MKCPACGKTLSDDDGAKFCMGCGQSLTVTIGETEAPSTSPVLESILDRATVKTDDFGVQRLLDGEGAAVLGSSHDGAKRVEQVVGGSPGGKTVVGGGDVAEGGGVIFKGSVTNYHFHSSATTHSCPEREIFLNYVDTENHDRQFRICKKGSVFRSEKTGEVLVETNGEKLALNRRDNTVSRKAVQFLYREGKMLVHDMRIDSDARTTYVNGLAIRIDQETELTPGDIVTIGSCVTFRIEDDPDLVTVKKDALIPISKEMMEALDPRISIHRRGRYFLNGCALNRNISITLGKRRIAFVLDRREQFRESMSINREMIGGEDPAKSIAEILKKSGVQDEATLRLIEEGMRRAQGDDRKNDKTRGGRG